MQSGLRPGAFVSGTLSDVPLAHALLYIRVKRLTGVLDLRVQTARHGWIVFHRGSVVSVSTTPTTARFGPVAYELGVIDGPTLDEMMLESTQGKKPVAELLLERAVITTAQHQRVLEEQACRRVHHMFTYPDTTSFTFREARPSGTSGQLLVDVLAPVWRALVDFPPVARVREVLGAMGNHRLRLVSEAPLERCGFGDEEKAVIGHLLERPRTIEELRQVSVLPRVRFETLIYLLVLARSVVPDGEERAVVPSQEMWAVEAPRPEPAPPTSSTTIAAVRGPLELGLEGVLSRALGVSMETPWETLGLPEGASAEAARAAFFRLSRVWNPDRLPPELEEARGAVERVFARMTEAHRLLTERVKAQG